MSNYEKSIYPRSAREALLYPLAPVAHMVERVREIVIEKHGDLKLVVGGKHGYVVCACPWRPGLYQGSTKNLYQGYTKHKKHSTAAFATPREAAILGDPGPRRSTERAACL